MASTISGAGQIINAAASAIYGQLPGVGKFLFGNFESWLDPWSAIQRAESRTAQDLTDLANSGINPQLNDNKYGHAMMMSHLQEEFGILGTPLITLIGLGYEAIHAFIPGHPQGGTTNYADNISGNLFDGQHFLNWLYDTPGDILANVFGQITGIFSTIGIGNPQILNRGTLMIPGPDYRSTPWNELAYPGYMIPPY